jgi:hypothetical protein
MVNIQNFVNSNRTGKAGLRIASITGGSTTLSLPLPIRHAAPGFSSSDVGKNIVVIGAGVNGGNLYTTISAVTSSTVVELAVPASTTVGVLPVPRAAVAWWDNSQDDTAAFNTAQDTCAVGNGILYCPGDVYIISSPLVAAQNLQSIVGDGAGETFFVCTPALKGTFLSIPGVPPWFSLGGAAAQGFTILGPGFQAPATVTAWSITSSVATFTADNTFTAGQEVLLQGFTGANNGSVNNAIVKVRATGLSNTGFQAHIKNSDVPVVVDTGVASLNWNGIAFTSDGADWISMGNIEIQAFAGDAVQLNDAIVSDFRKVIMSHCGQGFNDLPSPSNGNGGTSLNFDTCYASGNYKAGYYIRTLAYSSFNNCAADNNGVAYYLDAAENISFNGSGSEVQLYRNAGYPGYSYYFHGAKRCALNCPYATSGPGSDDRSTHLVFDSGAAGIFVNCFRENIQKDTIHPPANVFTIDKGCSEITIWAPGFAASGTKKWADGGNNNTVNASSGTFTLPTPKYTHSSPVASSDFSLSAGWGDTAAFDFVTGSFAMGSFQIKANGAGLAANPTVTFTFPAMEVGSQHPNIVWSRFDGWIAQQGYWLVSSISNTQITWVFVGTPAAGQNIGMQWVASSRG